MRLKDVARMNALTLPETTSGDYAFQYIDIGSVDGDGKVTLNEPIQFDGAPSRARRIVKRNDVLISTVRTYLKAIAPVDFEATDVIASTGFAVCTPTNETNPRYLAYAVRSDDVINEICKESSGISYPAINSTKLSAIEIPYCDLESQRRIVAYLDEKTAAIDARVAVLEKKLAAYRRLKASVINRAVTRGLDPEAKLKDSGVDWIGKIPAGWAVRRIRDLGSCSNGLSKGGEYFGHGSPFVSYGDVYRNPALPDIVKGLVESTREEQSLCSVKRGDVLFTRTSETVEELGFASTCLADIPDATFAGFLIRVRPHANSLIPEFSKHYFRGAFLRQYFIANTEIVTRASLSQDLLKGLPVLCPPLSEQRAIADYLDAECAKIDKMAELVTREIELYKKLKRSLINEVVTGKREVDDRGGRDGQDTRDEQDTRDRRDGRDERDWERESVADRGREVKGARSCRVPCVSSVPATATKKGLRHG